MNVPVEAQSLSKLNYLLANPPQYPRNPAHEAHQPLILYIVRVPGSRDVFLTPLKPPTKASISLEAIQTSLYYLHVHGPGDEEVRQSVEEERRTSTAGENLTTEIHRKPLSSTPHANYPASQRPAAPSKSYPDYQQGLDGHGDPSQLERYHARGSHIPFGIPDKSRAGTVSRKPVGPREFKSLATTLPTTSCGREFDAVPSNNSHCRTSPDLSTVGDRSPSSGSGNHERTSRSSGDTHSPSGDSAHNDNEQPPEKPPRPRASLRGRRPCPAVTLIRRDPTSGVQWNIGTISDGGKLNESNLRSVSIQLDTPGYTRFGGQYEAMQPMRGLDAESVKRTMTDVADRSVPTESQTEHSFVRTVEFRQQQAHGRQFRLQGRTNSMDTIPNFPIQNKPPRSVFSFFSPWQGFCSFSNGIDGRSLRCRHSLPSRGVDEDEAPASVAELRFNLAWSALSPRDADKKASGESEADTLPISDLLKEPRGSRQALRKGMTHIKTFSKDLRERRLKDRHDLLDSDDHPNVRPPLPARPQSSFDAEDVGNAERLSLRLGRERAGGGYKGNSAKLGKLIIEDEGLKMGDLVVAACMGIWWQHYADEGQ